MGEGSLWFCAAVKCCTWCGHFYKWRASWGENKKGSCIALCIRLVRGVSV